jgi:hypothetical protein
MNSDDKSGDNKSGDDKSDDDKSDDDKSDGMHGEPHDSAEFERFLAGDDALSRRLKALPQAEPSAELDAAVLASIERAMAAETVQTVALQPAANDAVGPAPGVARRLTRYWALPVGLAAGIVLAIAYRGHEQEPQGDETAQSAAKVVAQADTPRVAALPPPPPAERATLAPPTAEAPPAKSAAPAMKSEAAPTPQSVAPAPRFAASPSPSLAQAPSAAPPPDVHQDFLHERAAKSTAPEASRDVAAGQEGSDVQKAWTHDSNSAARESAKSADKPAPPAAPAATVAATPQSAPVPAPTQAAPPSEARAVTAAPEPRVMVAPRLTSSAPAPAPIADAPARSASPVAEDSTRAIEAAHADPVKWLAYIEQKLDARDDTAALAEWDKFLKAHPAFSVKDELSDKIKAARERQHPPNPDGKR